MQAGMSTHQSYHRHATLFVLFIFVFADSSDLSAISVLHNSSSMTTAIQSTSVLCTCRKRFKTQSALWQHRRDSPRHTETPQAPEQVLSLDDSMQRLSLHEQDRHADHSVSLADMTQQQRAMLKYCRSSSPLQRASRLPFRH